MRHVHCHEPVQSEERDRSTISSRSGSSRDSHLEGVPGFIEFHLLKGPEQDGYVLYASHSTWRSEANFLAWTQSEAFRKAHAGAGANKPLYLGHPEFEGFTTCKR